MFENNLADFCGLFVGKDSGQGIDKNRKKCRLRG